MATAMRQGKRPISSKSKGPTMVYDEVFGNSLTISPELKKEMDERGLVPRFVDAKKLHEFNGYHPKGWVPYKRKPSDTIGSDEFKFGNDPSGCIRRGSLILAVKTKEEADKHRLFLDQRAEQQTTMHSEAQKAKELRQFAKEKGLDVQVLEGVDANDE